MSFPAEQIPDGALTAPHHYLYAAYLAIITIFVVWDNMPTKEPVLTLTFVGLGLFGWFHMWSFYPITGAVMVLLGAWGVTLVPAVGLIDRIIPYDLPIIWSQYPVIPNILILILGLLMLDDALSHAFGIWTPADAFWEAYIYELMA